MKMTVHQMIDMKNDLTRNWGGSWRGRNELRDEMFDMNLALDKLARIVKFRDPKVMFRPLSGVSEYRVDDLTRFHKRVLEIQSVYLQGLLIHGPSDAGERKLYSPMQATQRFPRWRTEALSRQIIIDQGDKIYIVDAPDADDQSASTNFVDAFIIPGLWDGSTYIPGGFAIGRDRSLDGALSTATSEDSPNTYDTNSLVTSFSGGSNMAANDAAVATIQLSIDTAIAAYNSTTGALVLSGFTFSGVPSGATITGVKLKQFKVSSDVLSVSETNTALQVGVWDNRYAVTDTAAFQGVTGTIAAGHGSFLSTGAGANITTITTASELTYARIWLFAEPNFGGLEVDSYTLELKVDYAVLEVTYSTAGSAASESELKKGEWGSVLETTPMNAVVDIHEDLHPALCALAGYMATTPNPNFQAAMQAIRATMPDYYDAINDHANRHAKARLSRPFNRNPRFGSRRRE